MPVVLLCKLEQGGDVLRVFFDFSMSFVDESALLTLPTPPFTYSIALLFTLKLVVDFVSIEKRRFPSASLKEDHLTLPFLTSLKSFSVNFGIF